MIFCDVRYFCLIENEIMINNNFIDLERGNYENKKNSISYALRIDLESLHTMHF